MNKSDLKNGMFVEYKDGTSRVYVDGGLWTENGKAASYEDIKDDLKSSISSEFDINKIFYYGKLIWEREKEIDWSKIPVGTKVLVSDTKMNWFNGIFLRKIEHSKNDNCFRIVNLSGDVERWKYCKLAEEPKEEVTFDDIDKKLDFYCINHNKICDQACGPCVTKNILENYNVTRKDNK